MGRVLALLLLQLSCYVGEGMETDPKSSAPKKAPLGHLQPFGAWKKGEPVAEVDTVPEPRAFFQDYCDVDDGKGKPVVFRGAAKKMGAMQWGTDEFLRKKYGHAKIDGVEYNLKETRAGGRVENMRVLDDFLNSYNTSDIYMVSKLPKQMASDVNFLPCVRCGGFLKHLDVANMWMGRGGSTSVIHYDDQDNINCMMAGRKRFVLMHPKYKKQFEAHPNSKQNRFGWVDTDLDRSIPGYGAFMGKVDVNRMDLQSFPGWRKVDWFYADLELGDCLYIPYQWYHYVEAAPTRSINVHAWYWRPREFDEDSCHSVATPPRGKEPNFAECSWGYEPEQGHLGDATKDRPGTTCRKKRPGDKEELEL